MLHRIVLIIVMSFALVSTAQVGINTTTPDDGSVLQIDSTVGALVPPRMNTAQMNAIATPLDGAVVYNTDTAALHLRTNGAWEEIPNNLKTFAVLDRYLGVNVLEAETDSFKPFPLDDTHVSVINPGIVAGTDGSLTVNEAGTYLVAGALSTRNLPVGNHKYIISVFVNNTNRGYLNRGFVEIPGSSPNYWGSSGTQMLVLQAGDVISLRYVINNTPDTLLNLQYAHFSVKEM